MSTILKALRRLEQEETPPGSEKTDPAVVASEDLRDRIFAEEAAAQSLPTHSESRFGGTRTRIVAGASVVVLLALGIGFAWNSQTTDPAADLVADRADRIGGPTPIEVANAPTPVPVRMPPPRPVPRRDRPQPARAVPENDPSAAVPVPVPVAAAAAPAPADPPAAQESDSNRVLAPSIRLSPETIEAAQAANPPAADLGARNVAAGAAAGSQASTRAAAKEPEAQKRPAPRSPAPSGLESAAVVPTPAVVAASEASESRKAESRKAESPNTAARAATNSAEDSANSKAEPKQEAKPEPTSEPKPATPPSPVARSQSAPDETVERIDRRGLPDVVVVRTSWHPSADRRTAKIRVVASDETLTLREGDAIGGLVVQTITPSSVVFATGDIEIRRKVGATR